MATVFFSGGIDSTTLAFDVAKNPWRYGISPKTEDFRLLTAYMGKEKPAHLGRLATKIREEAEWTEFAGFSHEFVDATSLFDFQKSDIPHGGAGTMTPLSTKYQPDLQSISYAPGLHTLLATVAYNREWFGRSLSAFSDPQAFFGFQYDGPIWNEVDKGTVTPNDVSPDYIAALNTLVRVSGPRPGVRFRAPFLENRMDRVHILELAITIGVPLTWTSSCEQGWMVNCGYCGQCLRRMKASSYLEDAMKTFLKKLEDKKAAEKAAKKGKKL